MAYAYVGSLAPTWLGDDAIVEDSPGWQCIYQAGISQAVTYTHISACRHNFV
jgi:hypothetical protein